MRAVNRLMRCKDGGKPRARMGHHGRSTTLSSTAVVPSYSRRDSCDAKDARHVPGGRKSPAHIFDTRRQMLLALTQLTHLPVRHTHFAVHRGGYGNVLLAQLKVARAKMQFAETAVAVGNERTHTAGLSQR